MNAMRRSEMLANFADLMDDDEREAWIDAGMPVSDEELEATVGDCHSENWGL